MSIYVNGTTMSDAVNYAKDDSTPIRREQIVQVKVRNAGEAAFGVQAFVTSLDGTPCADTAPLKWSGFEGYSRTILADSEVQLDICGVSPDGLFLHTASDISPEKPVFTAGVRKISGIIAVQNTGQTCPFEVTVTLPSVA